ncbi:MAG: hypothetical protein ACI4WH_00610 [Oscillospiraceae bacterium]
MTGKQKCDYLRRMRIKIAEENGIEYQTDKCNFSGECLGTCPKCEEELRYLNSKIDEKISKGEKVNLDEFEKINLTSTEYEEIYRKNNERVYNMYKNFNFDKEYLGRVVAPQDDDDLMGIYKLIDKSST